MFASRKGEAPPRSRQGNRVVVLLLALFLATLWGSLAFDDGMSSQTSHVETPGLRDLPLNPASLADATDTPRLALWAASGSTIAFQPDNGILGGAPSETRSLPRLVLRRNGQLTDAGERTLLVELSGLNVPSPGLTVTLQMETYHGDPDRGGGSANRIVLWRKSRWVAGAAEGTRQATSVQFRHEFGAELSPGVATPTDYLRLRVIVLDPSRPGSRLAYVLTEDHALLLENEWRVALPDVLEEAEGAAPDELLVFYCDMFPARRIRPGREPWIPRQELSAFVGQQFVPSAVEAFRLQADVWHFPWYLAWTSHRSEGDPKLLTVALTPPATWYHGQAPANGHAGISINIDAAGNGYETLLDGMMSTFHHELFHNLQRGLYQNSGLDREGPWNFVTEGMAVLASSVAQPDVQLEGSRRTAYLSTAGAFLGEEGAADGQLNQSYADITYDGAAYWRFLYEQCAVGGGGAEDPAAGMGVMRRVLATLYAWAAQHPLTPAGFVEAFAGIMDQALAGSPCPFERYEESVLAFGRAIFALRIEGLPCRDVGLPAGCGLYNPRGLYPKPAAEAIAYSSRRARSGKTPQSHPGAIRSSYGIDIVEVVLDPTDRGRPLTVELRREAARAAEFRLEVWKIREVDRHLVVTTVAPEGATRLPDGSLLYTLRDLDRARYNRLGLIITRVDNQEEHDPEGSYTLLLR